MPPNVALHICCLTRITLAHDVKGGMEVHIKTLAEGLVTRGMRVSVVTTAHPDDRECVEEGGVHYYFVSHTRPGKYSHAWGQSSLDVLKALHARDPIDLIWGEGAGAYYYIKFGKKFLGVPVVTNLQGTFSGELRTQWESCHQRQQVRRFFFQHLPWRTVQYFRWDWYFVRGADAIISPSNENAAAARRDYGLRREKVCASVNGIDVALFHPDRAAGRLTRQRYGLCQKLVLFTCARLEPEKGVDLLLAAVQRLVPEYAHLHLLVAGHGSHRPQLAVIAQQRNIMDHVTFLEHVPNPELPAFYNACDIFVYPTLSWESFGIAVAEAMACGKPVVAARMGGIPTSVEHGQHGFLYAPRDVGALTHHLATLLSDGQMRERFGLAAREKAVARLSSQRMVDDALGVFSRVLGEDKTAG